jgi:hypothetical protein
MPLQWAHSFKFKRLSIMKNGFRMLAWATVVVLLCASTVAGSENISPAWKVGDRWQVRVVYPSPVVDDEWSAPVYWNYRVVGREMEGAEERYAVDVSEQTGRVKLKARLFYRCSDGSLAGVDMEKMSRGKTIGTTLVYEKGVPVVSERTLIPCDTPVFPLTAPSSSEYRITRVMGGGMKAEKIVRQDVRRLPDAEGSSSSAAGCPLFEVKCTDDKGSILFLQRWGFHYPWPLYGENRNMRYWLVTE